MSLFWQSRFNNIKWQRRDVAGSHGNAIVVLGTNYILFQGVQFQRKLRKERNIKENNIIDRYLRTG